MDLSQISNHELLNRVEKIARTERKITHLILWHIVEVEARHLHIDLGYTSLFKYLTDRLHYSEDAAYRRIQAARLLKKMPQLERSLEAGEVNLTQLQQVQKCLKKELESGTRISLQQTEKVLSQIHRKSSFETQKILAVEFNQPVQQIERIKPQQDDSLRMEVTFTAEQMQELQHAKELLSHIMPSPTWAELFTYLAKAQVQKRLGKSKESTNPKNKTLINPQNRVAVVTPHECDPIMENSVGLNSPKSIDDQNNLAKISRPHMKITTRRELLKKANHQCEYIHGTKGRCQSRFQLQVDHRRPLAMGGSNDFSNLRVLCQQHNLSEARRWGLARS